MKTGASHPRKHLNWNYIGSSFIEPSYRFNFKVFWFNLMWRDFLTLIKETKTLIAKMRPNLSVSIHSWWNLKHLKWSLCSKFMINHAIWQLWSFFTSFSGKLHVMVHDDGKTCSKEWVPKITQSSISNINATTSFSPKYHSSSSCSFQSTVVLSTVRHDSNEAFCRQIKSLAVLWFLNR